MGYAYTKNVVQWSKADYACPTAVGQDDIAVITRTVAPVGSVPNTSAGPVILPLTNVTGTNGQTVAGVLTPSRPRILFRVDAPGGTLALGVTLRATPPFTPPGAARAYSRTHLGARVRVLRAESLVDPGWSTPVLTLTNTGKGGIDEGMSVASSGRVALPTGGSGGWLVELTPSGNGLGAAAGYTEYASFGAFTLTISGAFTPTPLPSPSPKPSPSPSPPPPPPPRPPPPANLAKLECAPAQTILLSPTSGNCPGLVGGVPPAQLYKYDGQAGGAGAQVMVAARGAPSGAAAPAPTGAALQGPGVHVFTVSAAGQSCSTTVTLVPCPNLLPKARDVTLQTPGAGAAQLATTAGCAASPVSAADLVAPASLGVTAAPSVLVRTGARAAWLPAESLRRGSYFVNVTYPGGLTAASKTPVKVLVSDKSPPTIARAAGMGGGGLPADTVCVFPKRAGATVTSTCMPIKSIAAATDNCSAAAAIKTSLIACSGCSGGGGTTQSRACVTLGTRAIVRVSATDAAGNAATLDVPIVAYKDQASVPKGAKCAGGDPETARRNLGRRRGTVVGRG
jgi:hypothetical protein